MTERNLLTADERDAYEAPLCDTCGLQLIPTFIPVDNNFLPVDQWELFEQCPTKACNVRPDDPAPEDDGYYSASAKRAFYRYCPECGSNVAVTWLKVNGGYAGNGLTDRWQPAPGGLCDNGSCKNGLVRG